MAPLDRGPQGLMAFRAVALSSGERTVRRDAASSIASGIPSSRRQISATAPRCFDVSVNPGLACSARSAKSRTDSIAVSDTTVAASSADGVRSGGTENTCSPATRSPSRLVVRIVRFGPERSTACAISAHGVRWCSQLSSTMRSRFSPSARCRVSTSGVSASSRTPSADARACATRVPSRRGAKSTNHTPSG